MEIMGQRPSHVPTRYGPRFLSDFRVPRRQSTHPPISPPRCARHARRVYGYPAHAPFTGIVCYRSAAAGLYGCSGSDGRVCPVE